MSDRHDTLKYEYVKRRLYDGYVDRSQKKFDRILHQLAVLESWISDLRKEVEIIKIRLDPNRVHIESGDPQG